MPEMRQDPITKQWVVIATERAKRPQKPTEDINQNDLIEHKDDCFFCWGNEDTTPPEIYACRFDDSDPDSPGWLLRVVENKFAALNIENKFQIKKRGNFYNSSYATGKAEVIIETPKHSNTISRQSVSELQRVLKAYTDRYNSLSKNQQLKYIHIFRNCGALAGASLEHPHSQIIATPIVPHNIELELKAFKEYFSKNKTCAYCDIINNEIHNTDRIIYENDYFISMSPYASRFPFETLIIPKFHSANFEKLDTKKLEALAEIWKIIFYKLDAGLNNPPYNYFIHTAPTQQNVDQFYHWHVEIIPKLTIAAGFEIGTGMFINVTIPEECSDYLRSIEVEF